MVTIKLKDVDVTMPKCCDECPFRNVTEAFDENGMALFPITECSLLERFVGYSDDEHVKSKRLDDCPIINVEQSFDWNAKKEISETNRMILNQVEETINKRLIEEGALSPNDVDNEIRQLLGLPTTTEIINSPFEIKEANNETW